MIARVNDTLWLLQVTALCWWRGHAWAEFTRTRRGLREHCRYCLRCDRTEVVRPMIDRDDLTPEQREAYDKSLLGATEKLAREVAALKLAIRNALPRWLRWIIR